ncbi:MAG: hypothetical protein IKS83_08115 [Victivallales bacterium]|nr:hypothetical protein [Victivallales bacterium]
MKKVTIVCLADDQEQSLVELRRLGSVHVVPSTDPHSTTLDELRREQSELGQVLTYLEGLKLSEAERQAGAPMANGKECSHECGAALSRLHHLTARITQLEQAVSRLEPWGQFDEKALQRLEEHGWHAALVIHSASRKGQDWLAQFSTDDDGDGEPIHEFVVNRQNGQLYSLLVSRRALAELSLPRANFPEGNDLAVLRRQLDEARHECEQCKKALRKHAAVDLALLRQEVARLEQEARFEQTRDGMGVSGSRLVYLQGYVPEPQLDELRALARRNGWAIRYAEVAENDAEVPTKLVIPKAFRMAQVVLDFIGIVPGYREVDVSVSLLVFLALFCGMLIGDAGYGMLFTAASLWLFQKAKKLGDSKMTEAGKLLILMSLSVVGWGALTGNWFGLQAPGLPWFTNDQNNEHIQLFCFFLGAGHMALAHLWRAKLSTGWRERLTNIGWALFLWANYFTIKGMLIDGTFGDFTIPKWLYIIGTALIVCFGINWRSINEIINSPFTFINSFGDLLSYIRLFAVGLSSLEIAKAFNTMGAGIWHGNHWLIPVGILALSVGHILNVALAVMGVLVHGIRLNTLEFSGHIGLEWSGRPYRPFQ